MSLSLAFFWTKSHRLSSMQHSSPWIGKVANDVFDGATGPTSKGIGAAQRYYCSQYCFRLFLQYSVFLETL